MNVILEFQILPEGFPFWKKTSLQNTLSVDVWTAIECGRAVLMGTNLIPL